MLPESMNPAPPGARTMGVRLLLLSLLPGLTLLLGGCGIPSAASIRLSHAGPQAGAEAVAVAALVMSGPAKMRYIVVDPRTRDPSGAEAMTERIGPGSDGAWRMRLAWKSARPGSGFRWAQEIQGDTAPDGSLRFLRIVDDHSQRSVSFEPGLVTAPTSLGDARLLQEDIAVTLLDGASERRLRAKHTITGAGRELIETPAGIYAAQRVHLDAVASLGPLSARRSMAVWLAAGAGVVAQYQADAFFVLGIPAGSREMLLLAAPLEDGSPAPAAGELLVCPIVRDADESRAVRSAPSRPLSN
ncbi:MAG: hypothetical protein ACF8R7_01950 [Phycisphaerales bacterium JB039]